MRKQQLVARACLLAVTLLVGTAQAQAPAAASPPGKGKHGHDDAGPGKDEHGKGAAAKPGDAAAAPAGKGKDDDKGKAKDGDKDDKDKDDKDGDKAHGMGMGMGMGHGHGMHELMQELKEGKLKKADLKERLGALREHRDERMKEHREELKARWGSALATPSAREELDHHARRVARLNRAMVLAETEVTKDKDKLKERIQKLIDKENARHDQAMEHIKSMPSTPAAAAAPSASPVAAPAASVKAGEK